jgi:hypothetical protein
MGFYLLGACPSMHTLLLFGGVTFGYMLGPHLIEGHSFLVPASASSNSDFGSNSKGLRPMVRPILFRIQNYFYFYVLPFCISPQPTVLYWHILLVFCILFFLYQ